MPGIGVVQAHVSVPAVISKLGASMHKKLSAGLLALAGLVCASSMSGAATLDDVMARLDSLQRDNATMRQQNEVMRKEIAALRQKEQRPAPAQSADTRNSPSRQLSPEASSAMAYADLPVKGRYAEPPQAFSWTGFYIGVHGGYSWNSSDWNSTLSGLPFASQSQDSSGALGGIHAGANQQFGNWVLGLEADYSLIDAEGSSSVLPPNSTPDVRSIAQSKIEWLATFTSRFGYAFDRSLVYVKGGVAGAKFKERWSLQAGPAAFFDGGNEINTRVGWTVGAGFEYAFSNNWTASIEYDYLDFGTKEVMFVLNTGGGFPVNQSIENKLHLVKFGVHYRF
jgi:outer membrane immunogenic protein